MAESKEERIMQALETLLQGITIANGFENDVKSVQRFEMMSNDFVDVPLIILGMDQVTHKERVQPNIVWETGTVLIAVYIRHSQSEDSRSTDAILLSLDADIYNAVMVDRTIGGLSKDLSRVAVFPHDIEEPIPHVAHVSEFAVDFTHLIDSVVN